MSLNPPVGVARPAPAAKPPERLDDALRIPMVRHAMHLFIPKKNGKTCRIEVREIKAGVRLYLDVDDDGIGMKSVDLALSETTKLADMLNTLRRKVIDRAEWKP